MDINWFDLPYSHNWKKNVQSIFDPNSKITFPQFIMEMVLFNRERYWGKFPKIPRGQGWSNALMKQVRQLIQQSTTLCNYFPHVDNDPLVDVAFRNFFRNNRVTKIGQYRKTRYTIKGDRKVSNITQDEKDVINGVMFEYNKLIKQRDTFINTKPTEIKDPATIKFDTQNNNSGKKSLNNLLELEKRLLNQATPKVDTNIKEQNA